MRSNNFDVNVPVTMCTEVESQANNCENKALLWKNFKNSFTWLTSMKKFIFDLSTFLDPASFRSLRSKKWIKNWPEPKSHKFQKFNGIFIFFRKTLQFVSGSYTFLRCHWTEVENSLFLFTFTYRENLGGKFKVCFCFFKNYLGFPLPYKCNRGKLLLFRYYCWFL